MIKESLFDMPKFFEKQNTEISFSMSQKSSMFKSKNEMGQTVINNKYIVLKKLGQGSQAKVKLVSHINSKADSPQYYAMKVYFKPYLRKQRSIRSSAFTGSQAEPNNKQRRRRTIQFYTALDEVYREIDIMKNLDHQNLCHLVEVIDHQDDDKMYVIMDYYIYSEIAQCIIIENKVKFSPNINLILNQQQKLIQMNKNEFLFPEKEEMKEEFSEQTIKKLLKKLVQVIQHLHSNNIVHRDIKPANIMINEDFEPVLCDFGKAIKLKQPDDDLTTNIDGTYLFMPPECCSLENMDKISMKKADIWALGLTFYILIYKKFPFEIGETDLQCLQNIVNTEIQYQNAPISKKLKQCLQMMLEKDPEKRSTIEQISKCPLFKLTEAKSKHIISQVLDLQDFDMDNKSEQNYNHFVIEENRSSFKSDESQYDSDGDIADFRLDSGEQNEDNQFFHYLGTEY